jgi:extradiol dioxygenase family protein
LQRACALDGIGKPSDVEAAMRPRYLAFPVHDPPPGVLRRASGCWEGRSAGLDDFDFYGHQLSAHVLPEACVGAHAHAVDGDDVPVRHFGMVLEWSAWEALRDRLAGAGLPFLIRPHVRFQGKVGEQATLFVRDPSGNALEFKSFRDDALPAR